MAPDATPIGVDGRSAPGRIPPRAAPATVPGTAAVAAAAKGGGGQVRAWRDDGVTTRPRPVGEVMCWRGSLSQVASARTSVQHIGGVSKRPS
eukprot:808583-Prymnesium_polylepis.1